MSAASTVTTIFLRLQIPTSNSKKPLEADPEIGAFNYGPAS